MAKRATKKAERGPHYFQRGDRFYGDFRAYEIVGGRKEALAEPGSSWGTKSEETAKALFAARLAELESKRGNRAGAPQQKSIGLDALVRDHLAAKRLSGTSESHLVDLEHRLRHAIEFFGAKRDPRAIEPGDVRKWQRHLEATGRGRGGETPGKAIPRKPGTVRHFLNALSGLYSRAIEGLYVAPGYNPVAMLQEKPSGWRRSESKYFEVPDAALLLEAARVLEERGRVNATPHLHAIIGTFLLTGGRQSEILGLDVEDVSFDHAIVRFRPNDHRGLKTSTSVRDVPLWPQLHQILQKHVFGGDKPITEGLLFPAPTGMVGDLRKSLDSMAELAGLAAGEVRTRAFRHTYCSARCQTLQRIVKPGRTGRRGSDFEWVPTSPDTVAREMGHGGHALVQRVYGHKPRFPHRSEVVEYVVEQHRERLGERLTALAAHRVAVELDS